MEEFEHMNKLTEEEKNIPEDISLYKWINNKIKKWWSKSYSNNANTKPNTKKYL